MMLEVKVIWFNPNPDTVWNRLAAQLGREPTNEEAAARASEILAEAKADKS